MYVIYITCWSNADKDGLLCLLMLLWHSDSAAQKNADPRTVIAVPRKRSN